MSTRMLGLLATSAAAVTLTGGIAFASQMAPPPAPGAFPPSASASTSAKAKDGTDLAACRDADCEVEVRDGQEIAIDEKYGIDSLRVNVDGSQVTLTAHSKDSRFIGKLDASSPGSEVNYNGVTLRPRVIKKDTVILRISHS